MDRAENGCFIRPRPTKHGETSWISMVSHFNFTWKSACLEILQYVSPSMNLGASIVSDDFDL